MNDNPTIPCQMCGAETDMLGTKMCDRCWELERRIRQDPALARRILEQIAPSEGDIQEAIRFGKEVV